MLEQGSPCLQPEAVRTFALVEDVGHKLATLCTRHTVNHSLSLTLHLTAVHNIYVRTIGVRDLISRVLAVISLTCWHPGGVCITSRQGLKEEQKYGRWIIFLGTSYCWDIFKLSLFVIFLKLTNTTLCLIKRILIIWRIYSFFKRFQCDSTESPNRNLQLCTGRFGTGSPDSRPVL